MRGWDHQMSEKINGIIKCDKSSVKCDVNTAQSEDGTIKCWKNKGIAKYDKSTITCEVGTAQCDDGTIKCEKNK